MNLLLIRWEWKEIIIIKMCDKLQEGDSVYDDAKERMIKIGCLQ